MNFLAALAMVVDGFPKRSDLLFNRSLKNGEGKCLKTPRIVVPGIVTNPKSTTRPQSPNEVWLRRKQS
jgi:hypothetical protein